MKWFKRISNWWHNKFVIQNGPVINYIKTGPLRSVADILKNPPRFNPPPVSFDELNKTSPEVQSVATKLVGSKICKEINHPNLQAGWGCCHCPTFNGDQRLACKACKHLRCDKSKLDKTLN